MQGTGELGYACKVYRALARRVDFLASPGLALTREPPLPEAEG